MRPLQLSFLLGFAVVAGSCCVAIRHLLVNRLLLNSLREMLTQTVTNQYMLQRLAGTFQVLLADGASLS